jgi:succinyl-diaminopimelate desuccinylase
VRGTQGHVAYPHRTDNPIHRLVRALDALTAAPIDAGSEFFQPSTLQVTSIDVGNSVTNLVPASARAMLNIRFNERHSGASLAAWLRATLARYADDVEVVEQISGESFLTEPGPMVDKLVAAITRESGITPKLDTGGGTSDARFISRYCPVAEFGLVGATMHQVDECVPVDELHTLTRIYRAVIAAMVP